MHTRRWSSALALLLVAGAALALVATLAGCGPELKTAGKAKLAPIPAGLDAPVYIVVNDVTTHGASVSAARAEAFDAVVNAAWERGAGLVLITAGSTPESVRTVFSTLAVADDVNAEFTRRRQTNVTRTLKALFRSSDAKQTGGTGDLLAALREAQAQLRSAGASSPTT